MLLFAEGFDDLAVTDLPMRFACAPGTHFGSMAMVTGRAGTGQALKGYDGEKQTIAFRNSTTVIFGLAMWPNQSNLSYPCLLLQSGGTTLFSVTCNVANTLLVKDATGTAAGTIVTWRGISSYLEFKWTAGHLTIRCDGATVLDLAGNFGAGPANQITLGTSVGYYLTLDDIYVCDDTGAANNDFLGDTRILSTIPTGDGAELQWTPSSGTTHYTLLDEATPNGDTDYISAAAAGQTDTFTFPALTLPTGYGILRAVQVMAYAKSPVGGVDRLAGIARVGGTDYPSAEGIVQAVYTGIANVFEGNPATGNPWTLAEVNAAEWGVKRTL